MKNYDLIDSYQIDLEHLVLAIHLISHLWKNHTVFDKTLTVKLESQASELKYILDNTTYQVYL